MKSTPYFCQLPMMATLATMAPMATMRRTPERT